MVLPAQDIYLSWSSSKVGCMYFQTESPEPNKTWIIDLLLLYFALKQFETVRPIRRPAYQNLRPEIPRCCPNTLSNIMKKCWEANPDKRPYMDEVVRLLEAIDTSKGGGMIPEDQLGGCFCFVPARGP